VIEELGSGGFAVVYRAREEHLQRDVALKVLHSDVAVEVKARERFLREARALARVRHPNVLVIHGILEHEGEMALFTELVDGPSLAKVLEDRGPLAEEDVLRIGIAVCHALAAVHSAGIVHRDVKTSNTLLDRSGRVVLADFGLGISGDDLWGSTPP
jgi:serine/threonine protein kinase